MSFCACKFTFINSCFIFSLQKSLIKKLRCLNILIQALQKQQKRILKYLKQILVFCNQFFIILSLQTVNYFLPKNKLAKKKKKK
jgi:hypothetical protein